MGICGWRLPSRRWRGGCAPARWCAWARAPGIVAGELRHVRGSDVVVRAGGVLVVVAGPRTRPVPVLARYQERLLEAAAFAGEGLIIGGREPGRRNVTDDALRGVVC